MIAASDPQVNEAVRMFRSRIINVLVGCAVGLFFLVVGDPTEWKLPFALAVDRPRLVVRHPHPDDVAPGADHRGHRDRRRPAPPTPS